MQQSWLPQSVYEKTSLFSHFSHKRSLTSQGREELLKNLWLNQQTETSINGINFNIVKLQKYRHMCMPKQKCTQSKGGNIWAPIWWVRIARPSYTSHLQQEPKLVNINLLCKNVRGTACLPITVPLSKICITLISHLQHLFLSLSGLIKTLNTASD